MRTRAARGHHVAAGATSRPYSVRPAVLRPARRRTRVPHPHDHRRKAGRRISRRRSRAQFRRAHPFDERSPARRARRPTKPTPTPMSTSPPSAADESVKSNPSAVSKRRVGLRPFDSQHPRRGADDRERQLEAARSCARSRKHTRRGAFGLGTVGRGVTQAELPRPAPSLTSNPIALATSYVTGIVSSLAHGLLNPFAAAGGLPALPDSPTPWALLAWVRREAFNQSPTVTYEPGNNEQAAGLIFGDVGRDGPRRRRADVHARREPAGWRPGRAQPSDRRFRLQADESHGGGRRHRPVHGRGQRRGVGDCTCTVRPGCFSSHRSRRPSSPSCKHFR